MTNAITISELKLLNSNYTPEELEEITGTQKAIEQAKAESPTV